MTARHFRLGTGPGRAEVSGQSLRENGLARFRFAHVAVVDCANGRQKENQESTDEENYRQEEAADEKDFQQEVGYEEEHC